LISYFWIKLYQKSEHAHYMVIHLLITNDIYLAWDFFATISN